MNEVRDILMRTKRLLTSGRWIQHNMRRYDGVNEGISYCLVGGLRETSGHHTGGVPSSEYILACKALAEACVDHPLDHHPSPIFEHILISYNDAIGRSVDEVAALIDRAVEKVTT